MSLIHFHRFLIASAILFCLGFGVWMLVGSAPAASTGDIVLAFAFFAGAIALAYYLARLRHFLKLPPERPDRGER